MRQAADDWYEGRTRRVYAGRLREGAGHVQCALHDDVEAVALVPPKSPFGKGGDRPLALTASIGVFDHGIPSTADLSLYQAREPDVLPFPAAQVRQHDKRGRYGPDVGIRVGPGEVRTPWGQPVR